MHARRPTALLLIAAALLLGNTGCFPGTSEAAFVGDATEIRCDNTIPHCLGLSAGCELREDQYLTGTFPGSRKFSVESPPGDWRIRVRLFLDPNVTPRFPGTDLEISWYEPGCADQYRFQLIKDNTTAGDLFERAGRDNVFEVEKSVVEPGDHLVTVFSDATTRYVLRVQLVKDQ